MMTQIFFPEHLPVGAGDRKFIIIVHDHIMTSPMKFFDLVDVDDGRFVSTNEEIFLKNLFLAIVHGHLHTEQR